MGEVGKAPARRRHNERLMQGASGVAEGGKDGMRGLGIITGM